MRIKDYLHKAKEKRENREALPSEEAQRIVLCVSLLSIVLSITALLLR